eukprot:scaffold80981_cov23-Prasinocladus_malaysianus.AAC.1
MGVYGALIGFVWIVNEEAGKESFQKQRLFQHRGNPCLKAEIDCHEQHLLATALYDRPRNLQVLKYISENQDEKFEVIAIYLSLCLATSPVSLAL